jgi:NAD(P)H-dependent FMN reductase
MNKKILAFGASNSIHSINKKLATYAANQLDDVDVKLLDLNDYEMPIYSIDREKESGIPDLAVQFKNHIKEADSLIISFAEHNGAYTTAFKNIMDWMSRLEGSIWENKPMLLLATSPGGRGGLSVLTLAANSFKFMNKNSLTSFSLPSFNKNFSEQDGIIDEALSSEFNKQLNIFSKA